MVKITELNPAGPITGNEILPFVQYGETVRGPLGGLIGTMLAAANYKTSQATGEAETAAGDFFSYPAAGGGIVLAERTAGGSSDLAVLGSGIDAALSIASVCQRGSGAGAANKLALEGLLAQAVSENKSILIPGGDWYIDGGMECLTGLVPLFVEGDVYTNTTTAWLTLRTPETTGNVQNFFIRGGRFFNLNGTAAQKNSSIIKFQSAGALILYPEFRDVEGYGFYQMFDDDAGTYPTPFGQESRMNHGIVDGCVPHWSGALNAKYCFLRRTGSGTGWFYTNCRDDLAVGTSPAGSDPVGTEALGYPAFVRVESGGVNAVCGDILIDGHFSGLQVGALSIDGACGYRANVALTSHSQIDAQAKRGIFFDPAPTTPNINFTVAPANVGGNLDIALNAFRTGGHKFHAQGFGESHGGTYVEGIASGAQSLDLCAVQMQQDYSCTVELEVAGIVQGVAAGVRRKVYSVRHDGATVTATAQTGLGFIDPAAPGGGFFDFTATVAGDTVTFAVTLTGSAANSKLTMQYRVTGGVALVRRVAA